MDANTVATIALAGLGAAGSIGTWAVRVYVRAQIDPVANRLITHEQTDELIHLHVSEQLTQINTKADRMEEKIDRLIERRPE